MERKALNYLKQNVYPIKSVTDGDDFSDLMPLCEILKNVRIVGLGESTHGTREFFQMKHRITRFLVENMGYRVFTIEAGILPCMNINEYVMMGKGDRAKALASQGYWTWDTEEVTDMIEWMRIHNLNCKRGEECQFVGYDIKPVDDACTALRYIIKKVCIETYKKADELLSNIEELNFKLTNSEEQTKDDVLFLLGWLKAHEIKITEKAGRDGYNLAIISCRMIHQYVDGMFGNGSGVRKRDQYMAENIIFLMNTLPRDAKIIVWAHNFHVAVNDKYPSMGYYLHQKYGDKYYPFALTFTHGAFQSRLISSEDMNVPFGSLQEFEVGKPSISFWEHDLMQIRDGDFYIDLRGATEASAHVRNWALGGPKQLFGAGGGYTPPSKDADTANFFEKYLLADCFKGIIHIEKTTRSRPTKTGMRKGGDASK